MSIIMDTLRTSTISRELNDEEVKIIEGMFEIREYLPGENITPQEGAQTDNLYVLENGDIEVRIRSSNEESTIHVMNPGDLAGTITFVGGETEQVSASLHAVTPTKVLCLERSKFEKLVNTHPMIVYRFMRGVARNLHSMMRREKSQSEVLRDYIYQTNARY